MRLCGRTHRVDMPCWSSSSSRSLDFEPVDVSFLSPFPEDGQKHHLSRTHILLSDGFLVFSPSLTYSCIYLYEYSPTDSWLVGGDIISGIILMPVLSQVCIRHPFVGCYVLPASYHLSLRTPLFSGTRYTKLTLHIPCLSLRTRHFFKDTWFLLAETGVSKPRSVGEASSHWVASWPVP